MMTTRTRTAKPWQADFGNVVDGRPNHAGNSAARGETLSTMGNAVATLVLLRHGESEWNALNLFTGWVDVDLTEKGRGEAVRSVLRAMTFIDKHHWHANALLQRMSTVLYTFKGGGAGDGESPRAGLVKVAQSSASSSASSPQNSSPLTTQLGAPKMPRSIAISVFRRRLPRNSGEVAFSGKSFGAPTSSSTAASISNQNSSRLKGCTVIDRFYALVQAE